MFGIGLPEMLLIFAIALIVVGPDKLPDLARSVAKGILELKKTAENLKSSISKEGNPLDDIREDMEDAAKKLKRELLEAPEDPDRLSVSNLPDDAVANAAAAYQDLMQQTGLTDTALDLEPASEPDEAISQSVSKQQTIPDTPTTIVES